MSERADPRGPVRAVGKAMELLEVLMEGRKPLSLQELCSRGGLPKSTAHALLSTLREYGMIEQTADGRYCLGIRLYEYGCAVSAMWDVRQAAGPYLEQLAHRTGAGAYLALRSGFHVISIDNCTAGSGTGLQVMAEAGVPLPLHATAQGKLLLAFLPESEVGRYVRQCGLAPCTRHTVQTAEELSAELEQIRRQGYAVEDGEYKVGLRSVAAPVYDAQGQPAYALGVVGLFRRVASEEFQAAVAHTTELAALLSRAIGYRPKTQ